MASVEIKICSLFNKNKPQFHPVCTVGVIINIINNIFLKNLSGIIFIHAIVFVWSQYDGANMEQRTIGQNQEAKLKIVGEQWVRNEIKHDFFTFSINTIILKPKNLL